MLGGLGIPLSLKGLRGYNNGTDRIPMPAGSTLVVPPGEWFVMLGPYCFIQYLDPISQLWKNVRQASGNAPNKIRSDGANFRIANLTGCPVGAVVTNVGSGYTSAPTVTANAGGSAWKAIVGGLVNTSVTLPTFKGSNYTYPPLVFVDPPPVGGLPATAKAVISAGALTSITVLNQGAGYVTAPGFTFVSDPRDPNNPTYFPSTTTPINPIKSATATLTGSGTIAAVVQTDPGNPVTSTPTLAFSGGGGSSAAATAIMNYTVTNFTVAAGGAVYGNAQPFFLYGANPAISTATAVNTNPDYEKGLTQVRMPVINGTSTAGGAIQTTSSVIIDAGIGIQISGGNMAPLAAGNALPTTIAQATVIVGGTDDFCSMIPADG